MTAPPRARFLLSKRMRDEMSQTTESEQDKDHQSIAMKTNRKIHIPLAIICATLLLASCGRMLEGGGDGEGLNQADAQRQNHSDSDKNGNGEGVGKKIADAFSTPEDRAERNIKKSDMQSSAAFEKELKAQSSGTVPQGAVIGKILLDKRLDSGTPLWKVYREGNENAASYILGTVHVGANGQKLNGAVLDALGKVGVLLTETFIPTKPEDELSSVMTNYFEKLFNLENNRQLKDDINDKDIYGLVVLRLKSVEDARPLTESKLYDYLYGWAAYMNIMYATPTNHSVIYGVDYLLAREAAHNGIAIRNLESPMTLARIFETINKSELRELMKFQVNNWKYLTRNTRESIKLYQSGKIRNLVESTNTEALTRRNIPAKVVQELNRKMIVDRTRSWFPAIDRIIAQNRSLVAVGALHLYGEDGILAHLEKQGYTVAPVPLD